MLGAYPGHLGQGVVALGNAMAALTAFGLSLITRDGLLALAAFSFTFGALGWVGWSLLA